MVSLWKQLHLLRTHEEVASQKRIVESEQQVSEGGSAPCALTALWCGVLCVCVCVCRGKTSGGNQWVSQPWVRKRGKNLTCWGFRGWLQGSRSPVEGRVGEWREVGVQCLCLCPTQFTIPVCSTADRMKKERKKERSHKHPSMPSYVSVLWGPLCLCTGAGGGGVGGGGGVCGQCCWPGVRLPLTQH